MVSKLNLSRSLTAPTITVLLMLFPAVNAQIAASSGSIRRTVTTPPALCIRTKYGLT